MGSDPQPLEVVVIEDDVDVREGLVALIGGSAEFSCVRRYSTMEDAIPCLRASPPDIVLSDIGLPGMSGVEGIRLLRADFAELPILALTVFDSDDKVFEALCAGATGYVVKGVTADRLLEHLRDAAAGGAPMSPGIARRVVQVFTRFRPPAFASYRLTPQESEVLRLLADGHHKKTAAAAMGISINTVSFHMKHLYQKLQVHSKAEAVVKALREGLI